MVAVQLVCHPQVFERAKARFCCPQRELTIASGDQSSSSVIGKPQDVEHPRPEFTTAANQAR